MNIIQELTSFNGGESELNVNLKELIAEILFK
jgi:hypothetical protein